MFIKYKNGDLFNVGEIDHGELSFTSDDVNNTIFTVNNNILTNKKEKQKFSCKYFLTLQR